MTQSSTTLPSSALELSKNTNCNLFLLTWKAKISVIGEHLRQLPIFALVMEQNDAFGELLHLNTLLGNLEKEQLRQHLVVHINDLLLNDFNKLVRILYRVDVSEQKLKYLLRENPGTDAAVIIADLLIERQEQKIKTKQSFKTDDNIPGEDKW